MSFQPIITVARIEMKTLLRSWFFRIFALLAIGGLSIFNIVMNIESSGAPWIYKALAASIPYANLIILNLGQAVVAVFLASEFLKQDKKNDTVEVIYARSMSNGHYILGKTIGILAVFFVLNVLILLIGIGFSFLNNTASRDILSYFIYPLLISLPTLVFILGLSFFMMVLIKNQAVTFILVLGYIALTIFYLYKLQFHIFDYIGYNIPMMYSSVSGFADIKEILFHRAIYFFLGISLVLFTIYRLPRLPQPSNREFIPLLAGFLFLFAGGFFVWKYLDLKYSAKIFKERAIALNNQYSGIPNATILRCDLKLRHHSEKIEVQAKLEIQNQEVQSVDTLILALNPALKVHSVEFNDSAVTFIRKMHLLLIKLPNGFPTGNKANISIHYTGRIDENSCFLDRIEDIEEENFSAEVFTLRKRYAFLQKDFVCLTSESLWYPTTWAGYSPNRPLYFEHSMVNYSLSVTTDKNLTAISQGLVRKIGDGKFSFVPEHPLPKLSLIIGDYKKINLKVDSVEYGIYVLKGNDYFTESFKNIKDTLPELIRDLKKEYEAELGFHYPYKRFSLVEVPVHFALDKHLYSYTSDAVQPEMILSPEKGVAYTSSDFRNRRYWIEREMKMNNEEQMPEEIQSRMFKQFVRNNFLSKTEQYYVIHGTDWRTFSIFPQYYTFIFPVEAPQWPVLSLAFDAYFNERSLKKGSSAQWYENLSNEERMNLEMNGKSLKDILIHGLEKSRGEELPFQLSDLTLVKGKELFNLLRARFGEKEVDTLFIDLTLRRSFRPISFKEIDKEFSKKFNFELDTIVEQWYLQKNLPGFVIRDLNSFKVTDGEATRFQVRLTIVNSENVDGVVTVNIEENNPNRKYDNWWEDNFTADLSRKIYVPAHSSIDAGFVMNTEPARLSVVTHISKNLPYNLIYNLKGFGETRNSGVFDGVQKAPTGLEKNQDEVIVDNEDKGFSVQQVTNQAFLKAMISKNHKPRYKYTRLRGWNPEREWKATLNTDYYGETVRSTYYTRAGSGERKAVWQTILHADAHYEVYFYMNKFNVGWRRNPKPTDYHLTVYHDGGADNIIQSGDSDPGWVYLGTFHFSDSAKVEMSNKSSGDIVFADAVKWVKVK